MKKDLLKGLSEEQLTKIKDCKTQEEMLALAKEEGIELTNEQLEAVSGGGCSSLNKDNICPKCGCNSCMACDSERLPDGRKRYTYSCWYCHNHYYIYD